MAESGGVGNAIMGFQYRNPPCAWWSTRSFLRHSVFFATSGIPWWFGYRVSIFRPGIPTGFCHKAHGCTAEVLPWVNGR